MPGKTGSQEACRVPGEPGSESKRGDRSQKVSEVQEAGKPVEGARHQEACRVPGEPGLESKRGPGAESERGSREPGSQ